MRPALSQDKWSSYLDEAEEGMAGAGIDKNCPGVKKFLNRVLGMPVMMQNKIFSHFMSILEEKVCERLSRARGNATRGLSGAGAGAGKGIGSLGIR